MKLEDFFSAEEFREVVNGKFFTCEFRKLDGTVRKIRCRLGVTKGLKGGSLTYNPAERNNLIVWDIEKQEYRTIKFDRLISMKYNGTEEKFE